MYLNHQYEKNWCKRSLKKDAKMYNKRFSWKTLAFGQGKTTCLSEKCMVKTCDSTFVSLSDVSFKKKFTQMLPTLVDKHQTNACVINIQKLSIYNYQFWMFKGDHDIFANVINLLKANW